MNISGLLDSRDEAIMRVVASALKLDTPEKREIVEKAVKFAAEHWEKSTMPMLVGSGVIDRIMATEVDLSEPVRPIGASARMPAPQNTPNG
jgi:hypothetical protein